jgi:hypothetical protein
MAERCELRRPPRTLEPDVLGLVRVRRGRPEERRDDQTAGAASEQLLERAPDCVVERSFDVTGGDRVP